MLINVNKSKLYETLWNVAQYIKIFAISEQNLIK